jgi:hypothetical protein
MINLARPDIYQGWLLARLSDRQRSLHQASWSMAMVAACGFPAVGLALLREHHQRTSKQPVV